VLVAEEAKTQICLPEFYLMQNWGLCHQAQSFKPHHCYVEGI